MKPTKEQIKKCLKENPQENVLGNWAVKKVAPTMIKCAAKTNMRPETIVIGGLGIGLIAAFFLALGEWKYLIIGGILAFFSYILDYVDGGIARLKGTVSKSGEILDSLSDRIIDVALIFGICFGLYNRTGNLLIWMYGFIVLVGIFMTYVIGNLAISLVGGSLAISPHKEKTFRSTSKEFMEKIYKIIPAKIKLNYFILGRSVRIFIILLGTILNQLMLVLWFFMIIQNLYWIAIAALTYKVAKPKSKSKK